MVVDRINMDTKRLSILLVVTAILIGVVALGFGFLVPKKVNKNGNVSQSGPTPSKEVGFAVVRVLPSGFSPKDVTISKGMIVRFTNPVDQKVLIKWDGDTQYSKELVFNGHDIATSIFDKNGTYTYADEAGHKGLIVVK